MRTSELVRDVEWIKGELDHLRKLYTQQLVPKIVYDQLVERYQTLHQEHERLLTECRPIIAEMAAICFRFTMIGSTQRQDFEKFADAILNIKPDTKVQLKSRVLFEPARTSVRPCGCTVMDGWRCPDHDGP